MTHPVQYFSPWFRHLHAACDEIELTVIYATSPTPDQQGAGFGRAFSWDRPLLDGHPATVVASPDAQVSSVHSDDFRGLNVPECVPALLRTRPDVVLVMGWHSVTQLRVLLACRQHRIPVLYRGDTNLRSGPSGWRNPLWRLKCRLLLRLFHRFLAVGSRSRRLLRASGVPESKIYPSPHCVDNDYFADSAALTPREIARDRLRLPQEAFVLLFVGKLEKKKRPVELIRAAAQMTPPPFLLIAGTGPLEQAARAEADRLGVEVVWAGFVNQGQLPTLYAAADCLALPSDSGETWGLVVNEAMACGLPCVVSDEAGCAPDMVEPGVTGERFASQSVPALSSALSRLRDRIAGGHDHAPACRERARAHSTEAASAGLLQACRALARPRTCHRPRLRLLAWCGYMFSYTGMERMTLEVIRAVHDRCDRIHCILNHWTSRLHSGRPHPVRARVEQLGASWSVSPPAAPPKRGTRNPLKWARAIYDIGRSSLNLLKEAIRLRPTHVLMPDFLCVVINAPALLVLRASGCRVLLRLGNAPEPGPFYRKLWRAIDCFVDHYVGNSQFTCSELLAHGIPPRKASWVYNVAPHRDSPREPMQEKIPHRIIYVGQIIPPKGLDVLLEALKLLLARGLAVELDVVGQLDEAWEAPSYTGYLQQIRQMASSRELSERVRLLGWQEDVPGLMTRAGIHCCPSQPAQREAFGLVNVEAKQAGIPSVVTPTGALTELVRHQVDGWVCRDFSAEGIAEGLAWFLEAPARRAHAGEQARASLSRFERTHFDRVWRDTLSRKRRASQVR